MRGIKKPLDIQISLWYHSKTIRRKKMNMKKAMVAGMLIGLGLGVGCSQRTSYLTVKQSFPQDAIIESFLGQKGCWVVKVGTNTYAVSYSGASGIRASNMHVAPLFGSEPILFKD
jgi:hypothetical protein